MANVSDLSSTKTKMGVTDGDPKKKKIKNQYGKYSGVIDDNGKPVDNPTSMQAMKTMANYMKNNKSDQSDNPSNVYRPEFSHTSVLYNKKTISTTA